MSDNQYLVTTPRNPHYQGKTCGVMFVQGRAFVTKFTIDDSLGLDVDQVAEKLAQDFGYEVKQVNTPVPVVSPAILAEAPVPAEPQPVMPPTEVALKIPSGRKRKNADVAEASEVSTAA